MALSPADAYRATPLVLCPSIEVAAIARAAFEVAATPAPLVNEYSLDSASALINSRAWRRSRSCDVSAKRRAIPSSKDSRVAVGGPENRDHRSPISAFP